MITKNFFVKIQNLILNYESRPVKWNPDVSIIDIDKFSNGNWDVYCLAQIKTDVLSNKPA